MLIFGDFIQDVLQLDQNNNFSRILTKCNLKNHITEPARITSTSSTCLDLILTNHSSIINNTEVLPPFQSDHCTVTAEITFKTYRIQSQRKTLWKVDNADINALETILENADWSFIQNLNDIDKIYDKFTKLLIDTANKTIPKKEFYNRPNDKPWMNNYFRKNMKQRDRLYYKMKHNNNENNVQNYKTKRNEVINLVREAKEQYLNKLQSPLSDPNLPPKQWHMIAQEITKLKNKNNPPPPLSSNGHISIHPFDKASNTQQSLC